MSDAYVPRPREVFGPARQLKDWWAADQIGKPLSIVQAFWVRRLPRDGHRLPHVIARSLARRGLLERSPTNALDLTDAGRALQALLGALPAELLDARWCAQPASMRARFPHVGSLTFGPLDTPVTCPACRRTVPAEMIAWGATGEPCIRCATAEGEP